MLYKQITVTSIIIDMFFIMTVFIQPSPVHILNMCLHRSVTLVLIQNKMIFFWSPPPSDSKWCWNTFLQIFHEAVDRDAEGVTDDSSNAPSLRECIPKAKYLSDPKFHSRPPTRSGGRNLQDSSFSLSGLYIGH